MNTGMKMQVRQQQNTCQHCGRPCQDEQCLDCRYRSGRNLGEEEVRERDTVEIMVRHSKKHFRSAFTSDQLQQISASER